MMLSWKRNNDGLYDESIRIKKEQLKTMEETIAKFDGRTDLFSRFERQLQLREEWKQAYHQLEQQREKVDQVKDQYETVRTAMSANQKS